MGFWNPKSLSPLPQDPHPQQTYTLSTGPLWGREKVLERIKGQMSKDQPLPSPRGEGAASR